MLGLSSRAQNLGQAYDNLQKQEQIDKELDFKYNERALEQADKEQIKLNQTAVDQETGSANLIAANTMDANKHKRLQSQLPAGFGAAGGGL